MHAAVAGIRHETLMRALRQGATTDPRRAHSVALWARRTTATDRGTVLVAPPETRQEHPPCLENRGLVRWHRRWTYYRYDKRLGQIAKALRNLGHT